MGAPSKHKIYTEFYQEQATLGINNPLSVDDTSNAAFGEVVPIPTCANAGIDKKDRNNNIFFMFR